MFSKVKIILFVTVIGVWLTACGALTPGTAGEEGAVVADALTFTDGLGRTVSLSALPQRIVSTSPSITESLFAIGAGGQIVGRDEASTYPEEALAVTDIGNFYGELPAESILALEPDLVIAAEIIPQEQVAAMDELGLSVYWQANPKDFDSLYQNLSNLGAISGHVEEAEALNEELQARVAAVEGALASLEQKPIVFYELDATDPENPWTTGAGTFIDVIIIKAGGQNAGAQLEGEYAQISTEALIAINPDYILLADGDFGVTPELVAARPGWDAIGAVQEGRVIVFDWALLSVPGPRLVEGLEEIAEILHPDLFE